MEVREIGQDDFEGFKKLMKLFFSYAGESNTSEKEIKDIFKMAIAPNVNLIYLGAYDQGRLTGLLSLTFGHSSYKAAPFAWCDDLIVDPDYRRRGVGKALMQKAVEMAKDKQCSNLLLGVGNNDSKARDFYASFGYKDMNCRLMTYPL